MNKNVLKEYFYEKYQIDDSGRFKVIEMADSALDR
jgi:hypothetical protein